MGVQDRLKKNGKWCARRDSNARPSDPESDALSGLSYGRTRWGERGDLNPRPPEPQSGALPAELRPPHRLACLRGFEPPTRGLEVRCSIQLSYRQRNVESGVVGARGFEPPTPCAQGRCATRLRHAPAHVACPTFGITKSYPRKGDAHVSSGGRRRQAGRASRSVSQRRVPYRSARPAAARRSASAACCASKTTASPRRARVSKASSCALVKGSFSAVP